MSDTACTRLRRRHLTGLLVSAIGWTAALLLFLLVRFVGLEALPQFAGLDLGQIDRRMLFLGSLCLGPILGGLFYLVNLVLDLPPVRRQPYGTVILIQAAGCVGLGLLTQSAAAVLEMTQSHQGFQWLVVRHRLLSSNFLVVLAYLTVVSSLFLFLRQVDRKFGPGNLWKLVIGTYHLPREEERVFMFLDLKGSTAHAERLGHARFSRLIQDCFIDLSVVVNHQAQVYQYVGDEVILFWDVAAGLHDARCIRAYFGFADRLRERADHYQAAYGAVPVFKAGVNVGCATVLEVGEIKRDISYLGDVLNTAARIQDKCGELGENLLISEALYRRLPTVPDEFCIEPIGAVALRGREQAVNIFRVRRRSRS